MCKVKQGKILLPNLRSFDSIELLIVTISEVTNMFVAQKHSEGFYLKGFLKYLFSKM